MFDDDESPSSKYVRISSGKRETDRDAQNGYVRNLCDIWVRPNVVVDNSKDWGGECELSNSRSKRHADGDQTPLKIDTPEVTTWSSFDICVESINLSTSL